MFRPLRPHISVPAFSSSDLCALCVSAFSSPSSFCSGGSSEPFPGAFASAPSGCHPERSEGSAFLFSLSAFSPATPVRTRRNCRKPFLFMHLLHNSRTPRGWGRHSLAFSTAFSPTGAIPLIIRTYEKTAPNLFGMRTSQTQGLKPLRICTYKKTQGDGGLIVNYKSHQGFVSRATIGSEGSLLAPTEGRPPRATTGSEGSLFAPAEGCLPGETIASAESLSRADHRPLFCSTFKPFNLQTFQRRFSTTRYSLFTTHGPPHNFYPPTGKLRHNPAARGQHPQPNPQTGRIQ
jgi:hypothetical protein